MAHLSMILMKFFNVLFKEIPARTIVQIINKAAIIHSLSFSQQAPRVVLYAELLFTVMHDFYHNTAIDFIVELPPERGVDKKYIKARASEKSVKNEPLYNYFNRLWDEYFSQTVRAYGDIMGQYTKYPGERASYYLLYYWVHIHENTRLMVSLEGSPIEVDPPLELKELKAFFSLLDSIQ